MKERKREKESEREQERKNTREGVSYASLVYTTQVCRTRHWRTGETAVYGVLLSDLAIPHLKDRQSPI